MGQVMMLFLKSELDSIEDATDENKNKTILDVMSMTGTWLSLDDLKQFLSPEQFEEIQSRMDKVVQRRMSLDPEYTQEEKERFLKEDPFNIMMNENGKLTTNRYFAHRNEDTINLEIDLEAISTQKLIDVAITEMKKHRAFQTFYDEKSLTAQEIPEILDIAIEKLTKMRELDVSSGLAPDKLAEFSEQIKEVENQIRDDIASEKGLSEIEEQSNENR